MRETTTANPIQGFAPRVIKSVTVWDCAADRAEAFRCPAGGTYQINGTGPTAAIAAGAVTVIGHGVTSITFSAATVIEVM